MLNTTIGLNETISSKLLNNNLRTHLVEMNEAQMAKLLSNFQALTNKMIEKQTKMISYKCYEAKIIFSSKTYNGYGRNEQEAFANSWKNFVDYVIADEKLLRYMKKSVKEIIEEKENNADNSYLNNSICSSHHKSSKGNQSYISTKNIASSSVQKSQLNISKSNLDQSMMNQMEESFILNGTLGGGGAKQKLNQTLNPESLKNSTYNNFTNKKSPQSYNLGEIEEILKNVVSTHDKSFQKSGLNISKKYELDLNDNYLEEIRDENLGYEQNTECLKKQGSAAKKSTLMSSSGIQDKKKQLTQTLAGSSHSRNKSTLITSNSKGNAYQNNERTSEEKNNSSLYLNQRRNSMLGSKKKTPVKGSGLADSGVMSQKSVNDEEFRAVLLYIENLEKRICDLEKENKGLKEILENKKGKKLSGKDSAKAVDDIQLSEQSEKTSVNVSYMKNTKPSKYMNESSSEEEDGEITSSKSIVKDKNAKIQDHYFPVTKKKEKIQSKPNKARSISFDYANKKPNLIEKADNPNNLTVIEEGKSSQAKSLIKKIPRIPLEVIPNYHGNKPINGSLNDFYLSMYEKRHKNKKQEQAQEDSEKLDSDS